MLLLSLSQQQHKCNLPLQKLCVKHYAMRNHVCAAVESNSTTTHKEYSNTDCIFWLIFNKKFYIYVVVESKSTITQVEFVIIEDVFPSILKCNIQFVLLLSQSQQQHKGDIPYFQGICN